MQLTAATGQLSQARCRTPTRAELADHLSVDESWREWASARLRDHHMANYLARLSTKSAAAVPVPFEDREKFVTKPASTGLTPGK